MNESLHREPTPVIDHLQVKIALLRSGMSLCEWSRRNGFSQPTAWRAMHNLCGGGRIGRPPGPSIAARHALHAFVKQVNNTNGKGQQ
jgi:hypothetical protein